MNRGLKICCSVSVALLVIVAVVLIILVFTVFKPKEPTIITRSVTFKNFQGAWPALFLNFTLDIKIKIDNQNYEGFHFQNSTAYVSYRGNVIGEAPIMADTIPARANHNINTSVTIFADKLFQDDNFLGEFFSGIVNFTSSSTLHGRVIVLKLFKLKATGLSNCDISIFVIAQQVQSVCNSKVIGL